MTLHSRGFPRLRQPARKSIGAIAVTLVCVTVAVAADGVRVSGTYSNLYYNREGGDLLGTEFLIFPSRSATGFSALVQLAEGGAPFAVLVPVSVTGVRVEFTIPNGGLYAGSSFSGTVSRRELVRRWSSGTAFGGGGEIERLRRGKSYWQ